MSTLAPPALTCPHCSRGPTWHRPERLDTAHATRCHDGTVLYLDALPEGWVEAVTEAWDAVRVMVVCGERVEVGRTSHPGQSVLPFPT